MPLTVTSGTVVAGVPTFGVIYVDTSCPELTVVRGPRLDDLQMNYGELERRAWAHYATTRQPTFITTTTTNMTNFIVTGTTSGTVTCVTTNGFTQPLTRLYAATGGSVTAGPYVGFDEAEQMAAWAAACRQNGQQGPRLPSVAEIRRRRKRKLHAGRRALRRSIEIYASFRGMAEIRQFLRGQQIIIPGCAFDYRVRKTLSVLEHSSNPSGGHTPYQLGIARKGIPLTDPALASGCLYFDSMPVIDQILALSMNVSDPDEEQRVIRTANWTPHRTCDRETRSLLRAY